MRYTTGLAVVVFAFVLAALPFAFGEEDKTPLEKLLEAENADWPNPSIHIGEKLHSTFSRGFDKAKELDAPLYIELSCPKRQRNARTLSNLLNGKHPVRNTLRYFVKCRIDDLDKTDARVFDFLRYQDLDKLYWVWLLSPDGRTYGVFGGSSRSVEDKQIPLDALDNALKRVLDFHYADIEDKLDYVGANVKTSGEPLMFSSLPFYKSWTEKTIEDTDECVSCHNAYAAYNQREIDARRFRPEADFYRWPFSENAGVEFEEDDGVIISSVIRGSAADKAGVSSGDRLVAANGRMLFSSADFRAVLASMTHRSCKLELVLLRNGELVRQTLSLRKGWKEHDIYWRKSITKTIYGTSPGFPWSIRLKEAERKKLGIEQDVMAVKIWFGRGKGSGPAFEAGLRRHHVIVAVNGERPDISGRAMQVYFKLNFKPGQRITLTILDNGKERKITYKAP